MREFQGKLDLTAWRKYEGRFTLLWAKLLHKTDDEASEAIMRVLPGALREGVTLEEEKRDAFYPTLRIGNVA